MLFKFKSKAAADLIMLAPDARRLLQIMLGHGTERGIIEVAQLPEVIARLEAAVKQDEAARQQVRENAISAHPQPSGLAVDEAEVLDPVRLSQRAAPMVKMLKRCQADESAVVWGV
ncbi:MAG: DUF1840 domain-containing protein [Limnohabitans sp.]